MKKILTIIILYFFMLSLNLSAQVAITTDGSSAHPSAMLEVKSTDKGFLPPRMTTAQRNAISSPAAGLMIYNTDVNCLQWHNGTGWYDGCDGTVEILAPPPMLGADFTNGFQDNATCADKLISVTSCSAIAGATINDDAGTADGVEYDWTGATGFVAGGTTRALVEIGGQCWFSRNADNIPSAYEPVPTWNTTDVGWSGYYTGGPYTNEGRLYQWSAAMNGSAAERAQGVCPAGWHLPSDCEWMYLEHSLGMSVAEQQNFNYRYSGSVGSLLSILTSGGTNSSGFTALLVGSRPFWGTFGYRGSSIAFWSSSESNSANARRRTLSSDQAGVARTNDDKTNGFSVRCLKD